MMPNSIQTQEQPLRPRRSREDAAKLLAELRAAYRTLSPDEQTLIRTSVLRAARQQFAQEEEDERNECSALAS
jgi:hypothetical protein